MSVTFYYECPLCDFRHRQTRLSQGFLLNATQNELDVALARAAAMDDAVLADHMAGHTEVEYLTKIMQLRRLVALLQEENARLKA